MRIHYTDRLLSDFVLLNEVNRTNVCFTQLYSPFEKAAQLYAKNVNT